MTKKELVEKVAKEQNLDPKKLSRLTVAELEKMDVVVKDENSEVEDVDIFEDAELEEESQEADPAEDMVEETPVPVERKLVGHHPITKKPVYK